MDRSTRLVLTGGGAIIGAILGNSWLMVTAGSAFGASLLERPTEAAPSFEDLSTGTLIVGHPGNGKTYLVLHLITSEWMPHKFGGAWISPKGAEELLGRVPADAVDRIELIQPFGRHPLGLNPLETYCQGDIHERREEWNIIAQDLSAWFASDVNARAGWKQVALVQAGTRALLEWGAAQDRQVSAVDLVRLFIREDFRKEVLLSAGPIDESVFGMMDKQALDRTTIMVQSRFASPTVAALLGQPKGINLRELLSSDRWLVFDTPKEKVPDSAFICRTAAGMIQRATVHKQKLRHGGRPFMVVCDEIQEYPTNAFAAGIYTAREYGLGWVLLHQTRRGQLADHPELKAATEICQTKYIFGVTPDDGADAAKLSGGRWEPESFVNLEKRHYRAIRRVRGGKFVYVDDGVTPDLPETSEAARDAILAASQHGPDREELLAGIRNQLRGGGEAPVCI